MWRRDTISLFLLVVISFVATVVIILSWCSCYSKLREPFRGQNMSSFVCSEECPWAAQQVMGLLDPTHKPDTSRAFLARDDPASALKFGALRNVMIEHAIHQLRQTKDFILFFTEFEFRGDVYLLPAKAHSWTSEMRTEAFATPRTNPSHFEEFVEQFNFFYGRQFSCIVPEGVVVTLKPVTGGSYPGEPIVIGQGNHTQLVYHKGPIEQVTVEILSPTTKN